MEAGAAVQRMVGGLDQYRVKLAEAGAGAKLQE
jgi:hypothetical protein